MEAEEEKEIVEGRGTDLEISERVNTIAKAMLDGYTNRKILLQFLAENYNWWGKKERMMDYYIRKAKEILNDITENDLDFEKNIALNRLDALYTMNYKIHDFRECRNIIEARAKLLGLNAETKIDMKVSGEIKPVIEFGDDE